MQERAADEVAQAKKAEDEAKVAARKADREAADAARIAKFGKGAKQEQAKAEAARKKEEADRKREEADQKEAERVRRSLQTAELQKLGRGLDPKVAETKKVPDNKIAIPTTAKIIDAPKISPEMVFLRRLHKGACGTFGTVLGPDANEAHRNHFHFDLAARKRSAFCE
jgi:Extensin-like protein C-terminus